MKTLITSLLFFVGSLAFAGDGGGTHTSCRSESGRTALTVAQDHFSSTKMPNSILFWIDGAASVYSPQIGYKNGQVVPIGCLDGGENEGCINITEEGNTIYVQQGAVDLLEIEFSNGRKTAQIKKGFLDPRKSDPADRGDITISLKCSQLRVNP